MKAGYWNGTSLQTYATKPGDTLFQGNGTNGGWNYYTTQFATTPYGPWAVTSGSQELNGTYNMMGNVWQWMESPYSYVYPPNENDLLGFRVASVPEPGSLVMTAMIAVIGLMYWWRKHA